MPAVLRNTAKCGIIIPGVDEHDSLAGLVAPGQSITVPTAVANTDFVKNLLEIGELDLEDLIDEPVPEEEEEEDKS